MYLLQFDLNNLDCGRLFVYSVYFDLCDYWFDYLQVFSLVWEQNAQKALSATVQHDFCVAAAEPSPELLLLIIRYC